MSSTPVKKIRVHYSIVRRAWVVRWPNQIAYRIHSTHNFVPSLAEAWYLIQQVIKFTKWKAP